MNKCCPKVIDGSLSLCKKNFGNGLLIKFSTIYQVLIVEIFGTELDTRWNCFLFLILGCNLTAARVFPLQEIFFNRFVSTKKFIAHRPYTSKLWIKRLLVANNIANTFGITGLLPVPACMGVQNQEILQELCR